MSTPIHDLGGVDAHLFPRDAVLKFSHPHPRLKDSPLYVRSGANSIKWAYHLNTNVIPTYGGEVIQVLSCNVGPISIEGQTMGKVTSDKAGTKDPYYTSNDELQRIIKWFLTYMHVAGTVGVRDDRQARDERGIYFEYPARGWNFYIQVTGLTGFKYALEQQHSAPWSIQAEIISDNDSNYFSTTTMERFTDAATSQAILSRMQRFSDIGFNPDSPMIDPDHQANIMRDLKQFGYNFQALLASWNTGDFAHFGFNQLASAADNKFDKGSQEYYTQIFGSDYLNGDPPQVGGVGGSVTYTGDNNSANQADIVNHIVAVFESNGIPGDIAVATAMNESGLDPDKRQPNGDFAMGLFQTFPDGAGGSQPHANEVKQAFGDANSKVTKYYPPGDQITDAALWFATKIHSFGSPITSTTNDHTKATFAKYAQGAGDSEYISKIEALLPRARALIKQFASGGIVTTGTAQQLAQKLIDSGKFAGHPDITATAQGQVVHNRNGQNVAIDSKVPGVLLYLTTIFDHVAVSAVCSDHSIDGAHSDGKAVDVSALNHISIGGSGARALSIQGASALFTLKNTYRPVQLITAGTGNGAIDSTFLNYCLYNSNPTGVQGAISIYTSPVLSEHTNHIHVGY